MKRPIQLDPFGINKYDAEVVVKIWQGDKLVKEVPCQMNADFVLSMEKLQAASERR